MSEPTDINTNKDELQVKDVLPKKEPEEKDVSLTEPLEIKINNENNQEVNNSDEKDLEEPSIKPANNAETVVSLKENLPDTNEQLNLSNNSINSSETIISTPANDSDSSNLKPSQELDNQDEQSNKIDPNEKPTISNTDCEIIESSTNEIVSENVPEITSVPQIESPVDENQTDIKTIDVIANQVEIETEDISPTNSNNAGNVGDLDSNTKVNVEDLGSNTKVNVEDLGSNTKENVGDLDSNTKVNVDLVSNETLDLDSNATGNVDLDSNANDNQSSQNETSDLSKIEDNLTESPEDDLLNENEDEIEDENIAPLEIKTEVLDQSFGTENSDTQYGVHRKGEGASSTDDIDHESFSEGDSHDSEIDDEEDIEDGAERSPTEEEETEIDQGAGGDAAAPKNKRLDDDEDRRNPQYIPKKGTFYEHDDRTAEDGDELGTTGEADRKEGPAVGGNATGDGIDGAGDNTGRRGKVWKEKESRWNHDRYDEVEQSPKSSNELVQAYGYDIRNEDGPPRARRRRRYGRGPNKYTRNWEDEEAYGKIPTGERNVERTGERISRGRRGSGGVGRVNRDRPGGNVGSQGTASTPKGEDFPPLAAPAEVVEENKQITTSEEPVLSATYSNRVSQDKRHTGPLTKKDFPALSIERSDNEKTPSTDAPPRPTGRVTRGRGGVQRGRATLPENGRVHTSAEPTKIHDSKEIDYDNSQKRNRNLPRGAKSNLSQRQAATETQTQVFIPSGRGRGGNRGRGRGAFISSDNRSHGISHTPSEFKRNTGDYDREDNESGHKSNPQTGNHQQIHIQNAQHTIRGNDFRKSRKSENSSYSNQQSSEAQHRRQSGPMPPRLQEGNGNNSVSGSNNVASTGGSGGNRPKRYSSLRQRPLPEPQPQPQPPPPTQQQQQPQQPQQPQQQTGYPQPPPQQPQQQAYFPPPLPPAGGAYIAYSGPAADTAPVLAAAPPPPPPHQGPPQYAPFIPPAAPQRLPHQFIAGQPMINYVPTQGQFPPPTFTTFQNFTPVPPPVPQPPELYQPQGGITYYSPEEQVAKQRSITKKRPRTAIPIVPPPERSGLGHGGSSPSVQGEQLRSGSPTQYINQQEVA